MKNRASQHRTRHHWAGLKSGRLDVFQFRPGWFGTAYEACAKILYQKLRRDPTSLPVQ